jgi:hypothetical protein
VKCDPSSPNSPLLPFSGHLSVLPTRSPSPYQALLPTRRTLRKTPRLSFFALQHFQIRSPFFSSNRPAGRPKKFATSLGSSTLRVWLPSRCLQRPNPWKPLSAPNAPGLRPPELFSSRMIDPESPQNLPLLRFPAKLLPPRTGAPAASSHPKSRPPLSTPDV